MGVGPGQGLAAASLQDHPQDALLLEPLCKVAEVDMFVARRWWFGDFERAYAKPLSVRHLLI